MRYWSKFCTKNELFRSTSYKSKGDRNSSFFIKPVGWSGEKVLRQFDILSGYNYLEIKNITPFDILRSKGERVIFFYYSLLTEYGDIILLELLDTDIGKGMIEHLHKYLIRNGSNVCTCLCTLCNVHGVPGGSSYDLGLDIGIV